LQFWDFCLGLRYSALEAALHFSLWLLGQFSAELSRDGSTEDWELNDAEEDVKRPDLLVPSRFCVSSVGVERRFGSICL
jgi:hypothetical protein